MHTIKQTVGAVVANDTQTSIAALDNALVMHTRLCASILEGSADARLPIAASQRVLSSVSAGIAKLVESRADMVATVRALAVIQGDSSLAEEFFGCPTGPHSRATSRGAASVHADAQPVAA